MSQDNKRAWSELQEAGVAGLVGDILARSAADLDKIQDDLLSIAQRRIEKLERQLAYWRPLGQRYLEIRGSLLDPIKLEEYSEDG